MFQLKISVRDLVEFTLRKGDIDFKYIGRSRGVEGTRLHQRIQKSYGVNDLKEVPITGKVFYDDYEVLLNGRMDGLLLKDGEYIIDEIKSTSVSLEEITEEFNYMHWAQGMVYAFLFAKENNIDEISVQLTYCSVESKDTKKFIKNFDFSYLSGFVEDELIKIYIKWAEILVNHRKYRDNSIVNLSFPHKTYRPGQRKLIVSIYKTIGHGKKLFFNAPTGTGKTISTIFPSLLSMVNYDVEKIFYLTSKNTQKQVVESTLNDLIKDKATIKYSSLSSKEKTCFMEEVQCNPKFCPYAKGHFDRINEAIEDIFTNEDVFEINLIHKYAEKHQVCPFEYALDLTNYSDVVICDYNYIFDPRVSLKRYTEEKGNYLFLIDEAHNLVDRSKDMYSALLQKSRILDIKKSLDKKHSLYKVIDKINKEFIELKKVENFKEKEKPEDLLKQLQLFIYAADKWLAKHSGDVPHYSEILSLYFDINNFLRMGEYYGDNYRTMLIKSRKDFTIRLHCLDTSMYLAGSLEKAIASVFFSATLLPMEYFMDVLGGQKEDYHMTLESPFSEENLCIMINNEIGTSYGERDSSYEIISNSIEKFIRGKKGNYLVFFSSYEYMENVYEVFTGKYVNVHSIIQKRTMTDKERQEFISLFHEDNNIVAFAVLGGVFSESIDLYGDKLIGSIIVTVGLPMICRERDLLKEYYHEKSGKGFQYAYMYPGFNKVLQGVGRVIRSDTDKGAVLLIDPRYTRKDYQNLFPKHWRHYQVVKELKDMEKVLEEFWNVD